MWINLDRFLSLQESGYYVFCKGTRTKIVTHARIQSAGNFLKLGFLWFKRLGDTNWTDSSLIRQVYADSETHPALYGNLGLPCRGVSS